MKRLIVSVLALWLVASPVLAAEPEYASVFDRVMKTHTLRCAYTLYPGFVEKDPNTGKMSGLSYDVINELGKQLGIKIEWTDEVGTDVIFEGFKNHRYDMACSGYNVLPSRAWGGDATKSIFFTPINLYVRADESRFHTQDDFNDPSLSISVTDGEGASLLAMSKFSKARVQSITGLAPATDRFENVVSGKADFTVMEASIGADYIAKNPAKMKQFGVLPVSVLASAIFIPHNEFALKAMLDTGIETMQNSGALERIVKAHETYPGTILLPAVQYQLPETPQ